ncbi:hypothetical protein KFE25_000376 [Diacronema lutheri]|uniref:GPI inositol-deacylase n=1 Tax=Diacronema lutheri TaxID=2081491 RepID=A0A8J6CEM4_DIALT|nr:hypothetical protein KFE25_000376 [Diacronema lutheri]
MAEAPHQGRVGRAYALALFALCVRGVSSGSDAPSRRTDLATSAELASYISGLSGLSDELLLDDERPGRLLGGLADRTGGLVRKWQRTLTSLIPAPSPDIGWTLRELPPPRANATAAFYAALLAVQSNVHAAVLDAKYVYVLVPGLLAHFSPGYFRQSVERLRSLGLDARYLALDGSPGACSRKNAAWLRLALRNAHRGSGGRKLVIVAHSKGVLDTLLALALYPELAPTVRAVVALQAPFGGAAVADDISARGDDVRELLGRLLQRFDLGINSVRDMTYAERREILRAHGCGYDPRALGGPSSVRVLSLASRAPRRPTYALALSHRYVLRKHRAESDGLVCVADALLPGSLAVVMDEADHGLPVLPGLPGARLRGADVVEAAITVALTAEAELPLEAWDEAIARAL